MNPIIFSTALTLAILSFSVHSTDVIPKGGDAIRLQTIEYRDTVPTVDSDEIEGVVCMPNSF